MATSLVNNFDMLEMRVFTYDPAAAQEGINKFQFQVVTVDPGGNLADLADAMSTFWLPLYGAAMSSAAQMNGIELRRIWPTKTLAAISKQNAGVGTGSANMIPPQMAVILKRRTVLVGPGGRGRIFFPFVDRALLQPNGELDVAAAHIVFDPILIPMANSANYVDTSARNYSLQPILIKNPTTGVAQVITDSLLSVKLGAQRRRGEYGRSNPPGPGT